MIPALACISNLLLGCGNTTEERGLTLSDQTRYCLTVVVGLILGLGQATGVHTAVDSDGEVRVADECGHEALEPDAVLGPAEITGDEWQAVLAVLTYPQIKQCRSVRISFSPRSLKVGLSPSGGKEWRGNLLRAMLVLPLVPIFLGLSSV